LPTEPDIRQEVEAWRARARVLAARGRPGEALELYRRFFACSRAVPALYGIRLSFALAEWAELAAVHPPARDALVAARQAAADRLLPRAEPPTDGGDAATGGAGDAADQEAGGTGAPEVADGLDQATPGDAFAEVDAISEVLGEPQFSADLFTELDARAPATAADCAIAAHRVLMRTGRFGLARRYLTDPLGKITRLAEVLQMRLDRGFTHLPEQAREARRRDAVRDYATDVRDVLTLLTVSGEDDLAEETRRRAIDSISWAHVRDEVAEALPDRPDT
jgi:hypothetical protein